MFHNDQSEAALFHKEGDIFITEHKIGFSVS